MNGASIAASDVPLIKMLSAASVTLTSILFPPAVIFRAGN
jgi:hypothetical protein